MIDAIAEKLPSFSLTKAQEFKVITVAVATIFTFGASWALLTAGLTFYFEGTMHAGSQDSWYDFHNFSFRKLFSGIGEVYIGKIAIAITWTALTALGMAVICTGPVQTKLAEWALAAPVHFLFTALVQAPICEEILFRGFLQERFEDVAELCNRHVYPLPRAFQQSIANSAQAALFGLAHITNGQVLSSAKWLIASITGWTGYVLGRRKMENNDLLLPTAVHATNNFVASLGLLLTQ